MDDSLRSALDTASLPVLKEALAATPSAGVVPVVLDLTNPFENALAQLVITYRAKRNDYVTPGVSPWDNFDRVEDQTGGPFGSAVEAHIATKQARIRALGLGRREPLNEPYEDSLKDRAVYCIIAFSRWLFPDGTVSGEGNNRP